MSKQLALSAAFSIFMMAGYVLLGSNAVRQPLAIDAAPATTSVIEVSAPALPTLWDLLPILR